MMRSIFELLLARIEAGETIIRRTTTRLHKDGRRVPIALTASAVRDALGKLVGRVVIAELRKKKALCRALIENAVDLIAMVDLAGTILFGYHPDDRAQALLEQTTAAPESTPRVQLRFRKKDGSYCRISCRTRNVLHDAELAAILINARVAGE